MPLEPIDESHADARTAATLRGVRGRMGFVPNLLRTMAHAPAVMESYLSLSEKFATTSLTPAERQVVLLAVSQINGCEYCMAATGTSWRRRAMTSPSPMRSSKP